MPILIAAGTALTTGLLALCGAMVGGLTAAGAVYLTAKQARTAAAKSWFLTARREAYGQYIAASQRLVVALQARNAAPTDKAEAAVARDSAAFYAVYPDVQILAGLPVLAAARVLTQRLVILEQPPPDKETFEEQAQLVRLARHKAILAMRAETGLDDATAILAAKALSLEDGPLPKATA